MRNSKIKKTSDKVIKINVEKEKQPANPKLLQKKSTQKSIRIRTLKQRIKHLERENCEFKRKLQQNYAILRNINRDYEKLQEKSNDWKAISQLCVPMTNLLANLMDKRESPNKNPIKIAELTEIMTVDSDRFTESLMSESPMSEIPIVEKKERFRIKMNSEREEESEFEGTETTGLETETKQEGEEENTEDDEDNNEIEETDEIANLEQQKRILVHQVEIVPEEIAEQVIEAHLEEKKAFTHSNILSNSETVVLNEVLRMEDSPKAAKQEYYNYTQIFDKSPSKTKMELQLLVDGQRLSDFSDYTPGYDEYETSRRFSKLSIEEMVPLSVSLASASSFCINSAQTSSFLLDPVCIF